MQRFVRMDVDSSWEAAVQAYPVEGTAVQIKELDQMTEFTLL